MLLPPRHCAAVRGGQFPHVGAATGGGGQERPPAVRLLEGQLAPAPAVSAAAHGGAAAEGRNRDDGAGGGRGVQIAGSELRVDR